MRTASERRAVPALNRRLVVTLRRTFAVYSADHCGSFANAIAYSALLALVPLTVLTLAVAALFVRDPLREAQLRDALLAHLPVTTAAGREQLQNAVATIADTRPALGVIGLLAAAFAARGVGVQLRTGLNVAFGISKRQRLVHGVFYDLGLAVGLGLLLLLSLCLTLGIAIALTAGGPLVSENRSLPRVVLLALGSSAGSLLVSVLVFAVIYKVVARDVLSWRAVMPGAVLAGLAFEVLKIGFSQYAARVGVDTSAAGTLGVGVALLALPHFGAQITLFGAAFARLNQESRAAPADASAQPSRPPEPDLVAPSLTPASVTRRPRETPPSPPHS